MKEPIEKYKTIEKLELKELHEEDEKVIKNICCPSCNNDIIADHINLQHKIAKCNNCNSIFSIDEDIESLKNKKEVKQDLLRPEGIDLFHFKNNLDITIDQHIHGVDAFGIGLFPIAAVFSVFLYFFSDKVTFSPIIPIVLSVIGLYYIYKAANYSKNKTYIDINNQFISIKSRPKNFRKDKSFLASDVDQLYLKHAPDGGGFSLQIIVNTLNGQKHEHLCTVNTISKAKYLEQEIEKYLKIKNRKVAEATL